LPCPCIIVVIIYSKHYLMTIVSINRYLGGLIDLNYHYIITCEKTTPNYLRIGAS
jgi:hypothetical protein